MTDRNESARDTKETRVRSQQTAEVLEGWFAYGVRHHEILEEPQRTRFQGSGVDFNGLPLED